MNARDRQPARRATPQGSRALAYPRGHSWGRGRKKQSASIWSWWPVLLGCLLAPLAVRAIDILILTGPWGARALMPWAMLLQGHALHLPDGWADVLNICVLWLQFPIYGLLLVLLRRALHFGTALAITLAIHFLAFFVVAAIALS